MVKDFSYNSRGPLSIAIIGAGPAGLSTALTLNRALQDYGKEYSISVYEMANESYCCREASSQTSKAHIEAVLDSGDFVVDPFDFACQYSSVGPMNEALVLQCMEDHAQAQGIEVNKRWRLCDVRRGNGKVKLEFLCCDRNHHVRKADFVVDATGKVSAFARSLKVNRNVVDEATYLQALVDNPGGEVGRSFVEAVEPGWWYAANQTENKMLISFCTEQSYVREQRDLKSHWLRLLKQTAWIRQKVPADLLNVGFADIQLRVQNEPSTMLSDVCGERWLAVGDAACCYDPITDGGWNKAIKHGKFAGRAIARALQEKSTEALVDYRHMVLEDFNNHVGTGVSLYGQGNQFEQAQFWFRCFSN